MSATAKKVPKLRFRGFSGEWQEKRISEVFNLITDYVAAGSFASIKSNVTYDVKPSYAQLVRTTDLKYLFKNKGQIYVDQKAFNYLHRVNLDKDSIVLPNIGANIGESYFVNASKLPYSNNVLGPNAILLRSDINDINFLFNLFSKSSFINMLDDISGASGQPKFNKTDLKTLSIFVPSSDEQKKIAGFLGEVDQKIEGLQKKKELLEKYKKGMMQKIFKQEIRFKDKNGKPFPAWQEKTLDEIGKIVTGKTPSTSDKQLWNGSVMFVTPTDIIDGQKYQQTSARSVNSAKNILPTKSIMYTCIASIGKMALSVKPSITNQQINSLIPGDDYDNEFIYYTLSWLTPKIKAPSSDAVFAIINKTEFSKIKIYVPVESEQQKIVGFLTSLDDKIKLQESKLEQAKMFKKALLQQMFV